jgi:large-conductance mechanosensitive channel
MVFESIVADLLNRFLGDYVENLNRSQLKIGIWGGKINEKVVFCFTAIIIFGMLQCVSKIKSSKT